MITLKEFRKKMKEAMYSDDDINEQIMVLESTIEEMLKDLETK